MPKSINPKKPIMAISDIKYFFTLIIAKDIILALIKENAIGLKNSENEHFIIFKVIYHEIGEGISAPKKRANTAPETPHANDKG